MRALKTWRSRAAEEAFLLNPAFCGRLLWLTLSEAGDDGLPFELMFFPLPLVLHKPTRERLPAAIRTSIGGWVTQNESVKIGFAERCQSLAPVTREALLFLAGARTIAFENSRVRAAGKLRATLKTDSVEVRECCLKARFVGRWFAHAGTTATIFTLFGVRP